VIGLLPNRTVAATVASIALSVRFAAQTAVGNLMLLRIGVLLFVAVAAWRRAPGKWWVVAALAVAATVLVGLVSHAAAQPSRRGIVVAAQVAHICAAAAWLGVVMHLLAARRAVVTATAPGDLALIAELVRRFSPVALAAAALIALSGVYLAWRFLGTLSAMLTSTDGALRLTPRQVEALFSPDPPTTNIGNLEEMYRSAERTILNWRYAEFTHNWSGVFVILMGTSWLLQGFGGRVGMLAARFWPALLIPFALVVALGVFMAFFYREVV
jgi:hypothetical protein